MDTLTHALSGALVGRLFADRADGRRGCGRLAMWPAMGVGAIAAAFPDSDFLLGYVSELTYLQGHRGVTHSLLLLPLWGVLLAWLTSRLYRLGGREGPSWRRIYPLACAALFVHILGDLITQFGTMILAPFSDRRFGLGTTFIIDLVLSGLLVAGLVASALFRRSRVPAALGLLAVVAWVGVGAVGRSEAIEAARAHALEQGIEAVLVDAAPRPASPFNWTAIVFDGQRYHHAHINTRRQMPLEADESDNFIRRFSAPYLPVAMARWEVSEKLGAQSQRDIAREVWTADAFSFYRWFAMFPILDHVEAGGDGGAALDCAGFRDLRFEVPGSGRLPFLYGLCRSAGDGAWRLYAGRRDARRWISMQ